MKAKWTKIDSNDIILYQWPIRKLCWTFSVEEGLDNLWYGLLAFTNDCDFFPFDRLVWTTKEEAMEHCEKWFDKFIKKAYIIHSEKQK